MGYNSLVFINNDAMGAVDRKPAEWWDATKVALDRSCQGEPVEFGFEGYANYFEGVYCQHADVTGLIAVGGGHTSVVWMGRGDHSSPEDQVALLKRAAHHLGYHLVRDSRTQLLRRVQEEQKVLTTWVSSRSGQWLKRQQERLAHLQNLLLRA